MIDDRARRRRRARQQRRPVERAQREVDRPLLRQPVPHAPARPPAQILHQGRELLAARRQLEPAIIDGAQRGRPADQARRAGRRWQLADQPVGDHVPAHDVIHDLRVRERTAERQRPVDLAGELLRHELGRAAAHRAAHAVRPLRRPHRRPRDVLHPEQVIDAAGRHVAGVGVRARRPAGAEGRQQLPARREAAEVDVRAEARAEVVEAAEAACPEQQRAVPVVGDLDAVGGAVGVAEERARVRQRLEGGILQRAVGADAAGHQLAAGRGGRLGLLVGLFLRLLRCDVARVLLGLGLGLRGGRLRLLDVLRPGDGIALLRLLGRCGLCGGCGGGLRLGRGLSRGLRGWAHG